MVCDCALLWLAELAVAIVTDPGSNLTVSATCASPAVLAGRDVSALTHPSLAGVVCAGQLSIRPFDM